jgi:hypothetical protein
MPYSVRILLTMWICIMLAGCFQVETKVRVNPDGSGTVEEKMLLGKKMVEQMEHMAQSFSQEGKKAEPFSLYDPKKLREQAAGMGSSVEFVSVEPLEEKDFKGYRAIYSFKDINTLRLSRKTEAPLSEKNADKEDNEKPILFRFTPGEQARLEVIQPKQEKTAVTPGSDTQREPEQQSPFTPQQEKEMLELLRGMKFSLVIEVNGTITESNASYQDDNRITLFAFDFGRMALDSKKLELLMKAEPTSPEEAKEMLKDLPGVKVELNDPLEIVFER